MLRAGAGRGPGGIDAAVLRALCVVAVVGAVVALPFVSPFSEGVAAATPTPLQIFAAPNGSGGACTQVAPCSLARAQSSVRSSDGAMTSDIDVLLENGTYALTSPLSFGPQDSGTNGFDVVYEAAPGAHPVLSGGAPVTGWHEIDTTKDIWAAPIPSGFDTEQLYVDGQRVPRAQGLPTAYYLQTTTGFIASSPVLASWRDITNVSAVFKGGNGAWTQTSCPIASVKGNVITMQQPCWGNLHLPADGLQELAWIYGPQGGFGGLSGAAQPTLFENAYELLSPGHWTIDTTLDEMFYEPTSGQDMATASFTVPTLQSLLDVGGTLTNPVHNLTFSGLQFSYATWTQPDTADGFAEMQADWTLTGAGAAKNQGTCQYVTPAGSCPYASWTRMPGAVVLSAAHDVTVSGDTFTHLGGGGLDVKYGSQDDLVQGNEFSDISGSAIQMGSTNDPVPADVGAGNEEIDAGDTIADNYIHDVAIEWLGGVGIWIGYTQNLSVVHNQIDDVPYSAISMGWAGWHATVFTPNADPNVNSGNVISDNLLYDYMQVLGDGGAIYTNGSQATGWAGQLVLSGNVTYGGTNTDFALYTDTGSQYIDLSQNVVYDQPLDSFASGGCHTVGHIRLVGNYFSRLGPLYPCDLVVDVTQQGSTLVCNTLPPGEVPSTLLAAAGLEPAYRTLLDHEAPAVDQVGPTSLPLRGGVVLVSGSGFDVSTQVHFGTAPATSFTVLSGNYLLVTAPAGRGTTPVTVTTAAGTSAAGTSAAASGATVSYSSTPPPCVPLTGGGITTSLLP
ncbi:MAG TPA: right-handed parallel beta-helix repeat-containing protein [Acidimicrobiales bacterium]|nr:right-handed parallel beta-helix repeat-containing protein [Acidimicrobiales bacterium]